MASPLLGLVAPRSTDIAAGEPAGPVTVAPVSVELTAPSLMPNGELSCASETEVVVGADTVRRPRPVVPRSACWRSLMICVSPAWAPLPLRIASAVATEGVLVAAPEKIYPLPPWVLRIDSMDDSCEIAVTCPAVWPLLFRVCEPLLAAVSTLLLVLDSACNEVLAALIVVPTLVIVL